MQKNGFLLFILSVIFALIVTWANTSLIETKLILPVKRNNIIDYYLDDFKLLASSNNGQMRYQLSGQHIVHQQQNKRSHIFKPELTAHSTDGDIYRFVANEAIQTSGDSAIELLNNVRIEKKHEQHLSQNFEITTTKIAYHPLRKTIETTERFEFKGYGSTISGNGLSLSLNDEELKIHSNVSATYLPEINSKSL